MITILLFGETGVGKSTWINAFANYLSHETFENAQKFSLISLIPANFSITDSDYNEQVIKIGESENESFEAGESSTQRVKDNLTESGNQTIKIIDTPGIGDTRGAKKDSENLSNILSHISQYQELHGICILLKPNSSRLTVLFKYCINELLTHLHKTAAKNIVFCFTNARSTFYTPGDTFPLLKNVVNEVKSHGIDISLGDRNVYCVDNEAFRYLCCLQNGIKFTESQKENYKISWEQSAAEMQRMVKMLGKKDAHLVKDTVALFEAKKVILYLSKLQRTLDQSCSDYNDAINEKNEKFKKIEEEIQQLILKVNVTKKLITNVPQYYSTTVCTSRKCISTHVLEVTGKASTIFKRCHEVCHCVPNFLPETVPCVPLQKCTIMNEKLRCRRCGCSWSVHMRIRYSQKLDTVIISDQSIGYQIAIKRNEKSQFQNTVKELSDQILQNKSKTNDIQNLSTHFAEVMKKHAILPYNDATEDYLKMNLIEAERESDKALAEKYKVELSNHRKEKTFFMQLLNQHITTVMPFIEVIKALRHVICFNKLEVRKYNIFDFDENLLKHILTMKVFQQPNETSKRLSLLDRIQTSDETDEEYLSLIYQSTKECQFDQMKDIKQEMAILLFIHGLKNFALKNHILNLPEMPKSMTEIREIINVFCETSEVNVSEVHNNNTEISPVIIKNDQNINKKPKRKCWHCGSQFYHNYSTCYAKNLICKSCNKKGHIENACHQKKVSSNKENQETRVQTFVNQKLKNNVFS